MYIDYRDPCPPTLAMRTLRLTRADKNEKADLLTNLNRVLESVKGALNSSLFNSEQVLSLINAIGTAQPILTRNLLDSTPEARIASSITVLF